MNQLKDSKKDYIPILYKYLFLFLVGGFSYFYIEILFRGFSHFSMIVCGGLAFILCGLINQLMHFRISLITQIPDWNL